MLEAAAADPEGEYFAHAGIFQAAATIAEDCGRHGLLRALLYDGRVPPTDSWPHIEVPAAWQDCRGYQLILTGHSLGAGAATLLAMLLRPQFPGLRCYAFSPPGDAMRA